jgi:ubiquinol-cytochrome c reductase iron-sulfur subunit
MSEDRTAASERRRLYVVGGLCALGAGIGLAKYLTSQPQPPAGNPLPVDFGDLPPGRLRTVDWNGRTVWILRRSADDIASLAAPATPRNSIWPGGYFARGPLRPIW